LRRLKGEVLETAHPERVLRSVAHGFAAFEVTGDPAHRSISTRAFAAGLRQGSINNKVKT